MTTRILIMGLPGAGKTYLAERLKRCLLDSDKTVTWLNADEIRKLFNDWDFSQEGRIRQSRRMRELADTSDTDYCIVDFVAPLAAMRDIFSPDWTIWVDTIDKGRFEDTNKIFQKPEEYDFRVVEQNGDKWAHYIAEQISCGRSNRLVTKTVLKTAER